MRPKKHDELRDVSPWRTTPRWSIAIFLLAVFFVFASFAFVLDGMDLGRPPVLRLAITVVLVGCFAAVYAIAGITLRHRFWLAFVPIFFLQSVCMSLLNAWLPDAPPLAQLDPAGLNRFHSRLVFDGISVMVSVALGYTGFVVVTILESRRRIRLEFEKATIESELAAAREIQRLMVAEQLPPTPGFAIESIYRPASQVGGDFFQVIPLQGGQTLIVVGDVSGKGLSAAMIVSMLIGMLSTVSGSAQHPAQILAELNGRLFQRRHGGFVTCLAVCLDPSGRVAFANAGHLPPWLNGDEVAFAGSMPLSLAASIAPEQAFLEMRPGDRLTLLTDGVVEARDSQGTLFGFDRAQSLIHQGASLQTLAEAAQSHGQNDDLTVISILRMSTSP
jgi:hypothetical protein